jgi:hypothetical protein
MEHLIVYPGALSNFIPLFANGSGGMLLQRIHWIEGKSEGPPRGGVAN